MQQIERPSFFESPENPSICKNLWMKKNYFFPDPAYILLKNDFHTKKKEGKIKLRSLILTKDEIFITKVTQFKVQSGYLVPSTQKEKISFKKMEIFMVKMISINNSKMIGTLNKHIKTPILFNYCMKFLKYDDEFEILTNDLELFLTWKKKLSPLVIQTSFHDDFNVIKMIGKGSFAKVYLAQKKEDSQFYAIKAFNKDNLSSSEKKGKVI